ncbi:VOC family protein [Nocardioides sp. Bht2]|uniref:VOC family protein n=1 Tax=Nocardioides sp. Bht2 TaxID=3392297 RepID=UPI0039B629FA
MQRIIPNLWFNHEAAQAAQFYADIFGGKVLSTFGEGPTNPDGEKQPLTAEWEVLGMRFVGINGGTDAEGNPVFVPNEAFSLEIDFDDQTELERVWHALIGDAGAPSECGWLKDHYGYAWQLVPTVLMECLQGPDAAGAERAWKVMMETSKVPLDGNKLRAAYAGQ